MVHPKPRTLVVMSRSAFESHFDAARLQRLHAIADVSDTVWVSDLDAAAAAGLLPEVEVLVTGWGAPELTEDRLDRMPKLRAMVHAAGSIRPHVTEAFWRRGIIASNVADENAVPVAEFTAAAIILAGKKAPFLAAAARASRSDWSDLERFGELSNLGRTIVIVGFSRVGRRVVSLVRTLEDATCLVVDPHADAAEVAAAGARLATLEEALPQAHVLSLHAPALPSTRHMIGAGELALLPDHATVINTARGSLIDTAALEAECGTGRINAMLDVTDPEPLGADSILYDLPNVMITPHIAGSLGSEVHRLTDAALDELERIAAGAPPRAAISAGDLQLSA